ncbi:type II toxin-antitoxin system HicB family antitoxin [Acidisphaera sp. S103]|uniref:type II toxin-antitoxin system HicB family antitoxin n=1 Tax=Acidisphaera sp. S103 TaxID=1747223 RepID=UPI00131E2E89|nr:type II toxin-antitoxin system HicB family antitoxin [Acidisphaera sp. S103]
MSTRHYLGIAEPLPENWSISFPAFPGTVTTGCDFAELMTNARDALASVVAAMEEDGCPIPESFDVSPDSSNYNPADYHDPRIVLVPVEVGGRSVRINVTMDEGLVARLDNLANRAHASRSALLARGARMVLAVEAAD